MQPLPLISRTRTAPKNVTPLTIVWGPHELVGRGVVDARSRARMVAEPDQVAKVVGYELTAEQSTALTGVEGKHLAAVLEERLPKSLGIIW